MFGMTTWSFLFAFLLVALSYEGVAAELVEDLLSLVNTLLDATLGISLGGGALINIDLNAGVLANSLCSAKNEVIGVSIALLGLLRVCACVAIGTGDTTTAGTTTGQVLGIGGNTAYSCGSCPANSAAVCVTASGGSFSSAGGCACACNTGYYADATLSICIPTDTCKSPYGSLTYSTNSNALATCTCKTPYVRNSSTGQCTNCATGYTKQTDGTCSKLTASSRARLRRGVGAGVGAEVEAHHIARRHGDAVPHAHAARAPAHAHAHADGNVNAARAVFPQVSFSSASRTAQCPEKGETACPLKSGEFECVDTTSDLASCGGCVGADGEGPGENCLAIPGALKVECYQSKCQVASCFSGWYFDGSRCAKGERA